MGAAIDAFGVSADAMKRNPVLIGAAAVIGVGAAVLSGSGQIPFLGLVVGLGYFFVEPFLAGGYLGMANSAVDGEATFGDFTEHGKANYTDLLVARLVVAVPMIVYIVAVVIVFSLVFGIAMMGAAGATGTEGGSGAAGMLGALGIVSFVVLGVALLLPLIPGFFVQFYPAAIVIGDASALDSFKYSYKLVRSNLSSAAGYTLVATVIGVVVFFVNFSVSLVSGAGGGVTQMAMEGATDNVAAGMAGSFLVQLVIIAAATFVVKTIVVFVLRTYYVSFVRSVTGTA